MALERALETDEMDARDAGSAALMQRRPSGEEERGMRRDARSGEDTHKGEARGRPGRRYPGAAGRLGARAAIMAAALAVGACAEEKGKPATVTEPNQAEKSAAPETTAAAPTTSGAVAPSASQSASQAAAEPGSASGTWEGSYNAKKGTVELPSKVKDKVRARDDGSVAVGAGSVTLTISPDGELSGKASGALGDATLRGKAEGEMVRASVFPDNPALPSAMTGVLVGMLKDGVIRGQIRVAGPDATIVRESPIELKRK